jgi:thiol-disulfide isomerase/thioredoxin
MISMHIAALLLAVSGGGETVLLDFHADWCGPCRNMEPVVAQVIQAGYPVRKVNVDHDRALAERYHVTSIPCYVLLVDGQEVDRLTGASRAVELQNLFAKARLERTASHTPVGQVRGQSPDPPLMPVERDLGTQVWDRSPAAEPQTPPISPAKLLEASVRLTIEDRDGFSYGSGTIIDARGGEALVLTCGHIFRDSQGKGKISVDVFGSQPAQKISGRLVSYDLKRDVGLIRIHPGVPVGVARVAPKGKRLTVGAKVVSIGCDGGAAPTIRESKVTNLDKFLGPSNVQVAGQPVQGRSGGGLFDAQGYVVGVCNAADPADNEGLFAAASTVQDQLDEMGLAIVYQSGAAASPQSLAGALTSGDSRAAVEPPVGGQALEQLSPSERSALAAIGSRSQGAEVICIVRSLADPQAKTEIVVLDKASQAFLERLAVEQSHQGARHLTSLDVPRDDRRPTCPVSGTAASPSVK